MKFSTSAVIVCAAVLASSPQYSDAFTQPTLNALVRNVLTRNLIRPNGSSSPSSARLSTSSIVDIPGTSTSEDQISRQQPPLTEDDLYAGPDNNPPRLGVIKRMLPSDVFKIDTATSLFYFAVDFAAVAATMGFLNTVVTSSAYLSFSPLIKAASVLPLQILTGFAMWCMWCIGHDAGHSTVSKNGRINRIVGEIAHSVICLTPFRPWQRSHKKHHLNHNHLENDYSHQWFIREEKDSLHPAIKISAATRMLQLPILYFVYLFAGVPDGGHFFFYGRMWEGAKLKEKLNSYASVAVSLATVGTLWSKMGSTNFAVVCMVPWMVMSFWLFMVTYLQHHSDDGKLYTDDTFTFERGAFETVDRNYGKWVNRMSHHMMDGHVAHHLFFERIPHYKLEKATKAIVKGMEERDQLHLYKKIDTPHFSQEIVKQFYQNWFYINEKQVVREWKD